MDTLDNFFSDLKLIVEPEMLSDCCGVIPLGKHSYYLVDVRNALRVQCSLKLTRRHHELQLPLVLGRCILLHSIYHHSSVCMVYTVFHRGFMDSL